MPNRFISFEKIVRKSYRFSERDDQVLQTQHPFDLRNIHPKLPKKVKELFDDGHYSQSTFEAFKFLEKEIQKFSSSAESGSKLMMKVFGGSPPVLALTKMLNQSDIDEQEGYKFIFAGGMLAIRNPRGHEYTINDNIDVCLDHLSFVSMLLRKLNDAGYK